MVTKPREGGWGAKGLSGRSTKKRTFFAAALNKGSRQGQKSKERRRRRRKSKESITETKCTWFAYAERNKWKGVLSIIIMSSNI